MADRFTEADADCATVRLAAALRLHCIPRTKAGRKQAEELGVPVAHLVKAANGAGYSGYSAPALTLDYNTCYGGGRIEQMHTDNTGCSTPFGSNRCPARELYDRVRFALDVLWMVKAAK